jgi:hydrogenase maturation protein HypF
MRDDPDKILHYQLFYQRTDGISVDRNASVDVQGRRIEIRGIVQGVGFRPFVWRAAGDAGVAGSVRNDSAGVTIEAFGPVAALDAFVQRLRSSPPPAAEIRELTWQPIAPQSVSHFVIAPSEAAVERQVSVPADLATCVECEREIFDPSNRRFHYPFTNCTNCGPRFTMIRDIPYDRAATTMAPFQMCPECEAEYHSPARRRFHAEPNACPVCGPRLTWLDADGELVDVADPLEAAAEAIAAGQIVAVKGIGGFHLACDATSNRAVRRLRQRKHRDEKPFAVMVRDLAAAEAVAVFGEEGRRLVTSVQRPIVLVPGRAPSPIAEEVAPNNPLLGVLLPYTPLHHLLLAQTGCPLVMTSGNLSDEPIAYRNAEAVERLHGIADAFLVHDREIETRCDDSVTRVIGGHPTILRRSRGYVPRPVLLSRPLANTVLACGAQLKNTFCIGVNNAAFLGPHIGDLDDLSTYHAYEEAIQRMERFLRVKPDVIAHDLHPQYLSTDYAIQRPEPLKIGVQHHHAHVAAAMAECGLEGPVLGVAYDGTGYGMDGTAWGGELLLARYDGFERLATFRPIALPGGDKAIRDVWRIATALLEDAYDGDPPLEAIPLFQHVPRHELKLVRQMIQRRVNAPLSHGVGRYFDALGAIGLARTKAHYEGQIALEWNVAADPDDAGRYGFDIDQEASPWVLDLRPMVVDAVRDLTGGRSAASISARFHNTLIAATAELVRTATAIFGVMPVVLTGGCFQNARLAEGLVREIGSDFKVHLHGEVPPGDGGIALGQAVVADAVLRR